MLVSEIDVHQHRRPEHPIDDLLIQRWSPRAMSGQEVTEAELRPLFEAARWAPSSYNNQPWRFLYALRGTASWGRFCDLLVEGNRVWAEKAGALVVIASSTVFDRNGKPSRTHSFDTGAAVQNLALQAARSGLVAHAMQGFDYERARTELAIPPQLAVEAMLAIGHPGHVEELPEPLRDRERPSGRRPLAEIAIEGGFEAG